MLSTQKMPLIICHIEAKKMSMYVKLKSLYNGQWWSSVHNQTGSGKIPGLNTGFMLFCHHSVDKSLGVYRIIFGVSDTNSSSPTTAPSQVWISLQFLWFHLDLPQMVWINLSSDSTLVLMTLDYDHLNQRKYIDPCLAIVKKAKLLHLTDYGPKILLCIV